jgi:hypothetical protein
MEIEERRQVRVRGDDRTFVFLADPDRGRLVLREEQAGEEGEDVCALTIADPDELSGFLEGLRRVLGAGDGRSGVEPQTQPAGGGATAAVGDTAGGGQGVPEPAPVPSRDRAGAESTDDQGGDGERAAAVARARERDPKAFQPWTPEEESRLAEAFRGGTSLGELAERHGRSRRAIEMRLEKLGLRNSG